MIFLRIFGIFAVLLYYGVPATAAAGASAAELLRCAEIATRDERLDCYDLLAQRSVDRDSSAAEHKPATTAAATTAATGSAPPSSPPAASGSSDPKNFGLSPAQRHMSSNELQAENARIASVSSDKIGNFFVMLDNGQTWMVLDNDGRLSAGDAVTIKRAALNSFLMLAQSHHKYRVHRTH